MSRLTPLYHAQPNNIADRGTGRITEILNTCHLKSGGRMPSLGLILF